MPILQSELLRQLWSDLNGGIPYSPFVLPIFLLLFLHLFLKFRRDSNLNFPPSPPKLPIIGNLHQLAGKLPHRSFQALSEKYGPLMLLHLGQAPTLVVSSAEIVEEIVKNHDIVFSNRPNITAAKILFYGCADFGFAPYGEYWRKARKICVLELLSNKSVQSFQFAREEGVVLLINKIHHAASNGSSINLSEMLLATSYSIVSRCIIGQKAKEDGIFGELSKQFVSLLSAFSFGDFFPFMGWLDVLTGLIGRLKATFNEMDAFLDSVIEKQKTSENNMDDQNQKDFVQILLHLIQDSMLDTRLTQDNLKAILLNMLVAGVESTATTIEWAMAELLKNPGIMRKAQEEVRRVVGRKGKVDEDDINQMEYLKYIVKETLRLHPPGPMMTPREISARIKLRGYDILPKTRVLVNVWAIQRDPKLWDMPEVFLPERFENNHIDFRGQNFELIPFGVGRRGCPGISFGVAVLEFVIANLLYWFDWKLVGNADCGSLDMTEAFGISAYKKFPLHLVPIAYCS
ncbi:hypothetical protein CRYUN_Cryun12cG0166100 [Craigia yunnanensis]